MAFLDNNNVGIYKVAGFDLFGGRHCETSALQKVLQYKGFAHSEEMIFGLAGGMGFIYWHTKKTPIPFIGGRNGTVPHFLRKAGQRIGVGITVQRTQSQHKAYEGLKRMLMNGEPTIVYGDIAHLPYFMTKRHFGGHAFIVYEIDENAQTAAISDRGAYPYRISLEDLRYARSSTYQPFSPHNAYLRLSYPVKVPDLASSTREAIKDCCDAMSNAPIRNIGIKGIRMLADAVIDWPTMFDSHVLERCLIESFINLELAGTGGAAFRHMYIKYLQEANQFLRSSAVEEAIALLETAASLWKEIAISFLPDCCHTLRTLRLVLTERNKQFELLSESALARMKDLTVLVESLQEDALREVGEAPQFLTVTRELLLRCYELEKEAIHKLGTI